MMLQNHQKKGGFEMKFFNFFDGIPPEFVENRFFAVVLMCDDFISVYHDLFSSYYMATNFIHSLDDLDDNLKVFLFPVFYRRQEVKL